MNESILKNVRSACDIDKDCESFDDQLIPKINAFLFASAQAGVGKLGFAITSTAETWSDFLGEGGEKYIAVKEYIGLRVKLRFDPPENAALLTAMREDAKELEWRLYDEADISG